MEALVPTSKSQFPPGFLQNSSFTESKSWDLSSKWFKEKMPASIHHQPTIFIIIFKKRSNVKKIVGSYQGGQNYNFDLIGGKLKTISLIFGSFICVRNSNLTRIFLGFTNCSDNHKFGLYLIQLNYRKNPLQTYPFQKSILKKEKEVSCDLFISFEISLWKNCLLVNW